MTKTAPFLTTTGALLAAALATGVAHAQAPPQRPPPPAQQQPNPRRPRSRPPPSPRSRPRRSKPRPRGSSATGPPATRGSSASTAASSCPRRSTSSTTPSSTSARLRPPGARQGRRRHRSARRLLPGQLPRHRARGRPHPDQGRRRQPGDHVHLPPGAPVPAAVPHRAVRARRRRHARHLLGGARQGHRPVAQHRRRREVLHQRSGLALRLDIVDNIATAVGVGNAALEQPRGPARALAAPRQAPGPRRPHAR
jgi:hypothetical protein